MPAISGRGFLRMAPRAIADPSEWVVKGRLIRMGHEKPTFCVAKDGNAQVDKEYRQQGATWRKLCRRSVYWCLPLEVTGTFFRWWPLGRCCVNEATGSHWWPVLTSSRLFATPASISSAGAHQPSTSNALTSRRVAGPEGNPTDVQA